MAGTRIHRDIPTALWLVLALIAVLFILWLL